MKSEYPTWARLTRYCRGKNAIKKIVGVNGNYYRYKNPGSPNILERSKFDFVVEHGCQGFYDDAIEIQTTDCCQLNLHTNSVYFELEGTRYALDMYWIGESQRGLVGKRILIATPDQDDDFSFKTEIVTMRVQQQYLLDHNSETKIERWGFCGTVYHYHDNHSFALPSSVAV